MVINILQGKILQICQEKLMPNFIKRTLVQKKMIAHFTTLLKRINLNEQKSDQPSQ